MTADEFTTNFLAEVEAYCQARAWSLSQFGVQALNSGAFVARLQAKRVTLGSIQKAERFMSANPPEPREVAA